MKNIEVYKAEKYDSDKYEEVKENIYKTYDALTNKYVEAEYGLYNLNHGASEIDYRLYKGMYHVWMATPVVEGHKAIKEISKIVKGENHA